MIWLRTVGLLLSIAGVMSVALIPMWGAGVLRVAIGLILVGFALLAFSTRRTRYQESAFGGPYSDASGADMGDGGSHSQSGYDARQDGDEGH